MTDLVTRLRAFADDYVGKADRAACIETEAADAIEAAARERDAMRADMQRIAALTADCVSATLVGVNSIARQYPNQEQPA